MKHCYLTMVVIIQLFVSTAVSGQTRAGTETVSLDFQNTSVFDAFKQIQSLTGLNFIYNTKDLEGMSPLTFSVTDMSLSQAIDLILYSRRAALVHEITKDAVIIRQREEMSMTITGFVVDRETNMPVIGATVYIEDQSLGGQTNHDGMFTLTFKMNRSSRIKFSHLSYEPSDITVDQIMKANGRDGIYFDEAQNVWWLNQIKLKPTQVDIQEVVVTGIVNRIAESFTGSARKITKEQLRSVSPGNVFEGLKILDPSLRIFDNNQYGSDPNKMPDIQLRGSSNLDMSSSADASEFRSIYQSSPNQPLFILDGFETSIQTIFDMDVNRIASVTILKDAAAKALYGAKASSGVIIVQTLSLGTTGTIISVNVDSKIQVPDLRSYNLLNASEKLAIEKEFGAYPDSDPLKLTEYYRRKKLVDEGLDSYWLSKPVRTGVNNRISVMAEFGDNNLRTTLSASYNSDDGVMKGSGREIISAGVTTSYTRSNFSFRNNLNVSHTKSQDSPYGSFSKYVVINPYSPVYDEYGEIMKTYEMPDKAFPRPNPYYDSKLPTKLEQTGADIIENFEVEWVSPVQGLRFSARFGLTHNRYDKDEFYPRDHSIFYDIDAKERKGTYSAQNGKRTSLSGSVQANYGFTFSEKHSVFATALYEIQTSSSRDYGFKVEGFPSNNMTSLINALRYEEDGRPSGLSTTLRQVGVLGLFSYTYDNRYVVDATLRANGSSAFGDANKWALFTSVGIGWNLHREAFLKDVEWVKRLELRGTWGRTGNQGQSAGQAVGKYSYSPSYNYGGMLIPDWTGARLVNMENPDLKWSQKVDYNAGIYANLAGFDFKAEYYENYTSNMVTALSVAPSVGFPTVPENVGKIKNTGFEFYLSFPVVRGPKGFLNFSASLTTNKNKLIEISDVMREFNKKQDEIAASSGLTSPIHRYVDGQDMNAIWVVHSYGIDPSIGQELFRDIDGNLTYVWNVRDQVVCGTSNRKFNGTLGISGEYEGFGFSAYFTFAGGGQYYNSTLVQRVEDANLSENVDKRVLSSYWKKPGDEVHYDRSLDMNGFNVTNPTSRFVQDYNDFNFSSLQLYYQFKPKMISALRLKTLRLTVSMNDIWQWSSVGIERGLDYPFSRGCTFSLSTTF